jgi:hypothetical protein
LPHWPARFRVTDGVETFDGPNGVELRGASLVASAT